MGGGENFVHQHNYYYHEVFIRPHSHPIWFSITIVTNQSTHLINNASHYLINHFILKYTSYIIYYP